MATTMAHTEQALALAIGASLLGFGVAALVAHAGVVLSTRMSSAFKRYTAKQMLIAFVVVVMSAFGAGGKVIVRTASGILRWWLITVSVYACFSMVYVTYSEFPEAWLSAARFYNGNVGPLVHNLVIIPLQITDVLLRALLPLWNAGWWFLKTMAAQGLLPIMLEQMSIVLKMATTLLSMVEHLTDSVLAFLTGFLCEGVACLHPEKGVLDLISPMGDVREFCALGVRLLREMCSTLAAPLDLLVFPLMDLNLAEAVHNLGNSVVQLLVVIPRTTAVRCALAQGDRLDVLMCSPDVAPFFHFLVAGLSSLGQAVDNWANVAFLIVQTAVTGAPASPVCDMAASAMLPDLVAADEVFRGAHTAVVGLTDWLYAVTDGVTAVYMGHTDPGQAKTQAWPHPGMDVGLGVAAVTYSSVHELDVSAFSSGRTVGSMQTTAMMACNCTDDALLGMRILCSILPMAGVPSVAALADYLVQVLFPDTAAARLYSCPGVDIYVKSVRWSYTRYASQDATLGTDGERTTLPTGDCIARGTCRELDATVWVVPRCGQERAANAGDTACIPDAPCFPFCMAARPAGSGRDNLILARARRWREGLTVLGQDCAMASSTPGAVWATMEDAGNVSWTRTADSGVADPLRVSSGLFTSTSTSRKQECQRAPRVTSIVEHGGGGGSLAAAANVRLGGQPFAITGDTTLMEIGVAGGGMDQAMSGAVQVERLMGSEVDAFSLHPLPQTLPSLPRTLVPMSEAERTDSARVTVPYSYGTTRIAATNSRNYVFYASNPSLDVFGAYFEYCHRKEQDTEALPRMGLLASSSFAPMRVYRVAAYRRCATYSCGADLVRFTTIDGFDEKFDRGCSKTFNVSVVALEYLNEDNIGVMVQSSHVGEFSAGTQRFAGPRTSVRTYWLNPASMALRTSIWQTAVPSSNLVALCPAMQRLPRVGTFTAEVLNAGVFLLKTVVGAVIHTPGMVSVWRGGGACPPVGRLATYHSVLGGCGEGLYSLDDFFDSMDDAGAVFWHSLSLIGKLVASTGPLERVGAPLARVLDGTSQYGEAMIDLWSARAGVMTLTQVPVKEQVMALWASMQPAEEGGTRQQGLSYGSSAMGGWSRFTYKALSTMVVGVVRRLLDPDAPPLTTARVSEMLWADLYDLKDEFESAITAKNRMGCAGLRLIFGSSDGTSNPWADMLYHQCAAAAELTSGLMTGVAVNVFVLIPMAKCVCKDSQGSDMGRFVTETCAPRLPPSLRPTLFAIANEARAQQQTPGLEELQCSKVLDHVKSRISRGLDRWFENQHLALHALGNAVDYATTAWDAGGGQCSDFEGDPHVVVLVPQPVDYFARCAGTSMCKGPGGKCAPEWQRFQEEVARQDAATPLGMATTTVSVATESPFFPGEVDLSLALTLAVASVEMPSSLGTCLPRPRTTPPDYAVAVAEMMGGGLRVQFWCAPLSSSSGMYRSETSSGYGPTVLPGAVLSANFGDDTGNWVAALVQMPGEGAGQRVYLVNSTGAFAAPAFEPLLQSKQKLMRVENMWTMGGGILVDLVTRHVVSTGGGASSMGLDTLSEAVHLFLVPPLFLPPLADTVDPVRREGRWHGAGIDLMQYGGGLYQYTRMGPRGSDNYLFVPSGSAISLHRLKVSVRTGMGTSLWLSLDETVELGVLATPAVGTVMASVSQTAETVLSTSTEGWNWLHQTRLDTGGYVLGMYDSTSVTTEATIEGRCDALGCDGCRTLAVQRLCMAYSQCSVMRCVGTAVHQMRPLCGVGGLLRHWGEMALKSTQGAWTIFTEMLGLMLELNLLSMQEAHLLWPDDSFLCSVCQSKDATAQFFSILTSTINAAMQAGEPNIAYMYGGASNVDTNADAALTISSSALNGFLHQVGLMPLFVLVAARQVMMCEVSGVMALMDTEGFRLSLRAADQTSASDLIAGQCLTVGAEVLATYPGDSPAAVGATMATIASNAAQLLLIRQISPALHLIDASLAYMIGVVHALGVLVMSHNTAKCNPPTFNMTEILTCACGDHRLQIPVATRTRGLAEGALWCTGVLSMIDSNSEPYLVYNQYTYAQLQDMSGGLDEYARCLGAGADGYKCSPPTPSGAADAQFFRQQGVTVANVLVKCRENYAKKQWDPHAYVMYVQGYHHLFEGRLGYRVPVPEEDPFGIRECMQADTDVPGTLSQRCHEAFLRHPDVQTREEDYWAYERVDSGKSGAQFTDGCLVFSGPADIGTPQFTDCVDGGDSDGTRAICRLAGHAWSPLSENQVPVASQHRVLSKGVHLDGLVQRLYQEARRKVTDAVKASIERQAISGSSHIDMQFFSVEGDMLHQTMDCMFLGPYSRVDYWPIPECVEGEECLTGPFWSRDDAGTGGRRGVDPDTCATLPTLPYTCGSPGRKAAMRYMVLNVLPGRGAQNESVIHETVMRTLEEILQDWNNTEAYGCACPGGTHVLSSCCRKGVPWLPERLNKSYIPIDPEKVMQAMEDDLGNMYRLALEDPDPWGFYLNAVAPGELAKYAAWGASQRVEDEARFDPTRPISTYTSEEEALAPLQREDAVLWDTCHAALKQTFFTLPLAQGTVAFDPELSAFDGDPEKLQEYVQAFTREAWRSSPLFRHYSPRHMPSDSHMCEHDAAPHVPRSWGSVSFSSLTQMSTTLIPGKDLPDMIPAFPSQMFRVGATDVCLCGWARIGRDMCLPPVELRTRQQVCAVQGVKCDPQTMAYNMSQEERVLDGFSSEWHCPEAELSPHWGFMDADATEAWLVDVSETRLAVGNDSGRTAGGFQTSARDMLRHGRSGMRIGNVHALAGGLAKQSLNPKTRQVPLKHGRLTMCKPPPPLASAEKLLMDELFPAAQAAEEGGATAYCLRYVMEMARLEIILLIPNATGDETLQREAVTTWRRRCGAQLHLLHLCVNLDVYRPRLADGAFETCPHFAAPPASSNMYVTKECLLAVDDGSVFYDPCRCMVCNGNPLEPLDLGFVMKTDRCRLRFDPRKMARAGPTPIGWVDGAHPLGEDPVWSLLMSPRGFAKEMLADPDAVGNVKGDGEAWWQAEGLMEENSELCDGVLDWWPEEWEFPVGYHVTVPCSSNDTAFRSFAQAFAQDEDDPDKLVYQHDLLRDANLADSHFGVGALCRRVNFGMPLVETNNMRYCTSIPIGRDAREDFTVPIGGRTREEAEWTPMKCVPSSRDVPWPDESEQTKETGEPVYDSSRRSIGTVPNMPRSETERTYPATDSDMYAIGPWQEVLRSGGGGKWGNDDEHRCQDFRLALCDGTAGACPPGYSCRGMVCSGDLTRKCAASSGCLGTQTCGGVCIETESLDCVRHSDCADPRQMCSGVGRCEQPMLVVHNRLIGTDDAISVGLATGGTACGSGARNYSLVGGSYWGNTGEDLLRVHGMCSFENWFKYTDYYAADRQSGGCATREVVQGDAVRRVTPRECSIMRLEHGGALNQSRWWASGAKRPDLMYLRPTNCDRDYERLQGFIQCAPEPGAAKLRFTDDAQADATEYNWFVRLHTDGEPNHVLLADMPERNDTQFGVLGLDGAIRQVGDLDQTKDGKPFVPCALIGQCFAPDFTVDSVKVVRTTKNVFGNRVTYPDTTVFRCGVFGLEDPGQLGCRLDTEVLPLYRALCMADGDGGLAQCKRILSPAAATVCENIRERYQPTNVERTGNLAGLRELFYSLPVFATVEQYLAVGECVSDIHQSIAARARAGVVSKGLYYPFMFVLKELPFDWFYQCIVMAGQRVNEKTWRTQDCVAYTTRADHAREAYKAVSPGGDSLFTYLRYVRGGYTRGEYDAFVVEWRGKTLAAVHQARGVVQALLYGEAGTDTSYPMCSKNMIWRIGEYGEDLSPADPHVTYLRTIIANWFDPQQCRSTWHTKLIESVPSVFNINSGNWLEQLSIPDPVNLEPQSAFVENTLMDLIQRFMLRGMGMNAVDKIMDNGLGALYYNTSAPERYNQQTDPLPRELIPTVSFKRGTVYVDTDDATSRVCAFKTANDPIFEGMVLAGCNTLAPTQSGIIGRNDSLKECGGTQCTSVPVLAKKDGQYNCRYIPAPGGGVVSLADCTETNGQACAPSVLDAMYGMVLDGYVASPTGSASPLLSVRALPWFEPGALFKGGDWSFSLAAELDFERNIQPNPELSVMCEITASAETSIQFMKCNSSHYSKLKKHVNTHYRRKGAVVVPARAQLEWPVDRQVLQQGVILSYTVTKRPLNQTYMDALFDDDNVCKGVVTGTQRVCWKQADLKFTSVNPWLLGNFNPFEVCDVDFTDSSEGAKEYVYTQCLKEGNPQGRCERYLDKQVSKRCQPLNRKLVTFPGVPRSVGGASLEYNMCFHRLEENPEGCMHDQGLLGGFDGSPVATGGEGVTMLAGTEYEQTETYMTANSLYEESQWSIPADFRQGFFADGRNPLWHGEPAPYGHLQVDADEIGGHRIGVVVERESPEEDTISTMTLERLPMGTRATGTGFLNGAAQQASRPTSEWVAGLQEAMSAEDTQARVLHVPWETESQLGASCPLQRWMMYSGGSSLFTPRVPSSQRAQHVFHRIHGGKMAHPTMVPADAGAFIGKYRSVNGFCACPVMPDIDQPQCRVPTNADSSQPCSLAQTIQALRGGITLYSHVFESLDSFRAVRQCMMQLDWPAVGGTLRDGSAYEGDWSKASSPTHKECHVLDRLRPFKYQYRMHEGPLRADKSMTTIGDGVCQTARVVTLRRKAVPHTTDPVQPRCLRSSPLSPDADSATFTCDVGGGGEATRTMPRKKRLSLQETLQRMKSRRQHCSQCSAPPSFQSASGVRIPAESSFGRLYRHSTERMLAKDLQDLLAVHLRLKPGQLALNASAWAPGEFMRNYMLEPSNLFVRHDRPPPPTSTETPGPREDALWTEGKPWVYCPTTSALRTGEGCLGTMSRADWVQRKTTLCPRMIRSYSAANKEGSMARTPFCSLDNTTDLVCKALEEAKSLVVQANCIASGEDACMPSPYVYHPATYVPSNNAWVHESVRAFYIKTDPMSCPSVTQPAESSQRSQQLLDFARQYQKTCPANSLVLVKQILMVVRVIITEVALIVTTLMSMAFKVLSLLVTGNVNKIKNMILDDWNYIRAKGQSMISTVSDLLIDALLNSGPMGERIRHFLQSVCEKINEALHWFLSVWCKYVLKYMIQVMAGMKKLVGIIGAGFEMLQDFVDEIFQGIMPASFIAKYANTAFQQAMEARYSRPTSERDDRGNARKNVPTGANARPISRISTARNYMKNAGKYTGMLASSPVGKVGGVLAAGSLAYDIYSDVMKAQMDDYLAQFWPDNFTLFGYADIVDQFDNMEAFLLDDSSCVVMRQYERLNMTMQIFPCLDNTLKRYVESNPLAGTTSIDATQCWADAAPSLGQNSLFSCGSTSTCCESATVCEDGRRIPCGTCPEPSQLLTNRYGCHDSLRKCVCGTQRVSVDRCSANMHCDAAAQCELVSSISRMSYGSIPCKLCPSQSQVLCLLKADKGMPGGCVCMLDSAVRFDVCSDRSGTVTGVDASRLCGYLHGGEEAQRGGGWNFDMENLMVVACAQVLTGVCSTVYNVGGIGRGSTLRMVVASSLRQARSGRRLLASEDPEAPTHTDGYEAILSDEGLEEVLMADGWDAAAAPCGPTVRAYQHDHRFLLDKMGFPLESSMLRHCGFWRFVGREALRRNNLSDTPLALEHETFLVSMDDVILAVMSDHGAGVTLVRHLPGLLGTALMFHPWMRPVRALGVMLANHMEHLAWIRDIDTDVHEALFGDTPLSESRASRPDQRETRVPRFPVAPAPAQSEQPVPPEPDEAPPRRRLLGVVQSANSVAEYSARVLANPEDGRGQVPSRVAGAWSTASFSWPPAYDYRAQACPLAVSALEIGRSAVGVVSLYFRNFRSPSPPKDRSLRGNLPTWTPWIGRVKLAAESPRNTTRTWASWMFRQVLAVTDTHPSHLMAFFTENHRWTLRWILETSIKCDLASTVTCSRHDKDTVMTTVIFLLGYFLLVRPVTQALGVGFISTLYILSYPGFLLWYAFGMPPSCFPMVPTCLMSDIIATAEILVPPVLEFPQDLRCGVVGNTPLNHTCLRGCEELGFNGWEDPLAFAICDTDPTTCQYIQRVWPNETGNVLVDDLAWVPMLTALDRASAVVERGSVSNLTGHRLCTWVSFVTATPALSLVGVGTVAGVAVVVAVLDLIPALTALLGQVLVFASA